MTCKFNYCSNQFRSNGVIEYCTTHQGKENRENESPDPVAEIVHPNTEPTSDKIHLEWIRDRLIKQYSENPNYDYMIRLQKIIDSYPMPAVTKEINIDEGDGKYRVIFHMIREFLECSRGSKDYDGEVLKRLWAYTREKHSEHCDPKEDSTSEGEKKLCCKDWPIGVTCGCPDCKPKEPAPIADDEGKCFDCNITIDEGKLRCEKCFDLYTIARQPKLLKMNTAQISEENWWTDTDGVMNPIMPFDTFFQYLGVENKFAEHTWQDYVEGKCKFKIKKSVKKYNDMANRKPSENYEWVDVPELKQKDNT